MPKPPKRKNPLSANWRKVMKREHQRAVERKAEAERRTAAEAKPKRKPKPTG